MRHYLWAICVLGAMIMATVGQAENLVQRQEWRYFGDSVMGGVSEGRAAHQGEQLRLWGQVSTANNGGFIQVQTAIEQGTTATARAVRLRVRGNGETYFIHIRTRATRLPWQYYAASFTATSQWQEVTLPLEAFVPSSGFLPKQIKPQTIKSVGLVAYGKDYTADVTMSALAFIP